MSTITAGWRLCTTRQSRVAHYFRELHELEETFEARAICGKKARQGTLANVSAPRCAGCRKLFGKLAERNLRKAGRTS